MFKNTKDNKKFIFISMLIFTIGVYLIGASKSIETYDYWWHIKAGEYICNTAHVPIKDVFSWYGVENDLEWTSHEWLSEVLLYIPYKLFGQSSGYIVATVLLVLTGITIYIFNKESYKKNLVFSIMWTILGVIITMQTFNPRPHMFSFILFLITLKVVFNFIKRENYRLIWIVPVISLLWGNLHGGSSNLPYIICIIAIITGLTEKDYGFVKFDKLPKNKLKTLIITSVLSVIALMFNPHGFDMIFYPYTNMGDTLMLNVIQEWRAPDLKILGDYPIYILMFIIYAILLIKTKTINGMDLVYILAFTFLTLRSVRFSPFLYAVSTFTIFSSIDNKEWDEKLFSIGAVLLGIMFIIMSMPSIRDSYDKFSNMKLIESSIIEDVKNNDFERIYNAYELGGYLIYNDIKPFIDGRADMYSKNILKDYHIMNDMILNARDLIEEYNFDSFLVENGTAIYNYLDENSLYCKISSGENYSLYKKTPINN